MRDKKVIEESLAKYLENVNYGVAKGIEDIVEEILVERDKLYFDYHYLKESFDNVLESIQSHISETIYDLKKEIKQYRIQINKLNKDKETTICEKCGVEFIKHPNWPKDAPNVCSHECY